MYLRHHPRSDRTGVLRIVIQDRQRLYREGIALILSREPDLEVVASVGTASELVAAGLGEGIDIVILELDVPEWDACRLVAALRKCHAGVAVVGTLAGDSAALPVRAYQAGVRTVFSRNAGIGTLLQTVRNLPAPAPAPARGSSPLSGPARPVRLDRSRSVLSPRETEVLGAIGAGATTSGVAQAMGISPKTVENHKQRIFSKLGVRNQAHAVAVAMRQGLLRAELVTSR